MRCSAIILACGVMGGVAAAQPVEFTGDVPSDFVIGEPGVIVVEDPGGQDVGTPDGVVVSGFDMADLRLVYDSQTDIMYVGIHTFAIAGDADGDGDPGNQGPALGGGLDLPDFGATESFAVSFDLDQDGLLDIVAGVPSGVDIDGFTVALYDRDAILPAIAFDGELMANVGAVFASPSQAAPHLEFTILGFSTLPSSGADRSAGFSVAAFLGSFNDAGTGEDFLPAVGQTVDICPSPDAEELCNDFDDDCDLQIDEGFPLGEVCEVGVGDCARVGVNICSDDGRLRCSADPGMPVAEICDGADNDCDGEVDNGFPAGEACVEGVGECARNGVFQCDGPDGVRCDAEPGEPGLEICDGLDNDCDGAPDEGFGVGEACIVGVGACEAIGQLICDGPDEVACNAQPGVPGVEMCDGVDNDCDGEVDEGTGGDACPTGLPGVCADGRQVCEGGALMCQPVTPASPEVCDGLDNDCDASTDEEFELGMACEVDQNGCVSTGVTVCSPDGGVRCGAEPREPVAELCNGVDDDCDGTTDEGFDLGGECQVGVGECARTGQIACDGEGNAICVGETPAAPGVEACDGLDNDCDGEVDEDFGVGMPCTNGLGECASTGMVVCGQDGPECNAQPTTPGVEICDNLDNDCDGEVDNGFDLGVACTVGTGACEGPGQTVCNGEGDGVVCDGTPGQPNTGADCAEGVDDDCDGEIDEPDDCQGMPDAGPDAGEVVTGADLVDNFNCDVSDSGSPPWFLVALLATVGLRRRSRRQGDER